MLTGAQRKILRQAILAAFDHQALEQVLSEATQSRDLNDLVSPTASFDSMVTQLITRSIDEGWTLDLLGTLLIARADNAAFVSKVRPIEEQIRIGTTTSPGSRIVSRRSMLVGGAALSACAVGIYAASRSNKPANLPRTLQGSGGAVSSVAFARDGRSLLSAGWDQVLRLWDPFKDPPTELRQFEGHDGVVWCVAVLPDGAHAVSAGEDGKIKLWNIENTRPQREFIAHQKAIWSVAVLSDGKHALSGSLDKTRKIWDLSRVDPIKTFEHETEIFAVAVTHEDTIAVIAEKGGLMSWDLENGKKIRHFEGHYGDVNAIAITSHKRLLSAGDDATLRLWDVESGKAILKFSEHDGHQGKIFSVAVSADDRIALSGGFDHKAKLWDLSSGKLIMTLEGHTGPVESVALSRDGRTAITGSRDKLIKVWDLSVGGSA